MMCKVEVRNVPEGAKNEYIVATVVNGTPWFFGAYSDSDRAESARRADPEHRIVVINEAADEAD